MKLFFIGHTEQGVATAARLTSRAALACGMKAQLYIPGTDGTDVRCAYISLAKPKEDISEKGPSSQPDFVIAFNANMAKESLRTMKERSILIVNSPEKFTNPLLSKKKIRAYTIDATNIALATTARTFLAAPMVGALSKAFTRLSLKALRTAIESDFYGHIPEHQSALEQGLKMAK